ncbi:hypothetical protein TTHERM_00535420 (macronuclear) [Tetrahymena thermophila SB210]|uniref:Uncharacterized protein n=1 Tax=Tetrahymena thermophila (strain SB210) TaxID=312017 RepID=I7MLW7_TETTS|nr:hypothetical protein TTHERM_00535420 [Tetrahymena thermophila SB210]EAS03206.2 hypothetical protein TTHERM_00535420 [Tetrahymena thermophila SB210]|eukprot:XP_001023451.2 hypothetical protein TTHERM_00535420 [Tetrahymena thermophila SB210]
MRQQYDQINQIGNENISSDTLYLKERFKNNVEDFNNTLQGLKQCMEQIKKNERDGSTNQKIDKFQRVEQMLNERKNKQNLTNKSIISQNTERFYNSLQSQNYQSQPQQVSTINTTATPNSNNMSESQKSDLNQKLQQQEDFKISFTKNNPQLQKFQQKFLNVLEPEENLCESDGSSFLRGGGEAGVEDLIKKQTKSQYDNQYKDSQDNFKIDRQSIGSGLSCSGNEILQGIQRFSDINEKKAEQFLQEFEDEDSIALPENICKLFPDAQYRGNRLSEIERDFSRKSYGSSQNDQNSCILASQRQETNQKSLLSCQDKVNQTQQDLNSEQSSCILQDLNIYQFYSNQQHALPIEDRLYVKDLSREIKIKNLQNSQQKRLEAELQKVPKISKQSDQIARNSARFQQNPDLVSRLMNDKLKQDMLIKQKQVQQQMEDEHRFTFAPQINQTSLNMNRKIENLYQWDQKRKIKQSQVQKQLEREEVENIQKMKQSTFICEGSKKIVEQQVRGQQKIEDRLIREGQSIQARKKLQQEKENMMIKELSNQKSIKRSQSHSGGLNSFSRQDETIQLNTTNQTAKKQQFSQSKQNSYVQENIAATPSSYIYYCPKQQYQEQNNQNIIQDQLQDCQITPIHQDNQQNVLNQNYLTQNAKLQKSQSTQNFTKNFQQNSLTNQQVNAIQSNQNQYQNSDVSDQNIQIPFPYVLSQQKSIHQKALSLHMDSKPITEIQQNQLPLPLHAYKKSEQIILPKNTSGKISVESLIQSAQFRKTKIFACDNQNVFILDKCDTIPLSSKNLSKYFFIQIYNKKYQFLLAVKDVNQLICQKQKYETNIPNNSKQIKQSQNSYNLRQGLQPNNSQKENIVQQVFQQKPFSKQASQNNLLQNQNTNNQFFKQIKNEKNGQSYHSQFQKRKQQRTNSCLSNQYFSQN